MGFSKRRSSKASISIPPTQIPLPRASLNKLPAQLRKPKLGGARRKPRGKNSRARQLAKGCEQRQPCAQVAGSKQRARRNKRQATRREVPRQRKTRQKVGPTSSSLRARFGSAKLSLQENERRAAENAVLTAQSRTERPSEFQS